MGIDLIENIFFYSTKNSKLSLSTFKKNMGLLYSIEKPKESIEIKEIENYNFIISENISENDYLILKSKIDKAEKLVAEEITNFSKQTFIQESDNKRRMNFRIGRAFNNNELIGYAIAYCELESLDSFLIDIIFVESEHRKNGIGFQLAIKIINAIISIETISKIKLITQDSNTNAQRLITKIQNSVNN